MVIVIAAVVTVAVIIVIVIAGVALILIILLLLLVKAVVVVVVTIVSPLFSSTVGKAINQAVTYVNHHKSHMREILQGCSELEPGNTAQFHRYLQTLPIEAGLVGNGGNHSHGHRSAKKHSKYGHQGKQLI